MLKEDGSDRARAGADCGARGSVLGRLGIGVTSGVVSRLGLGRVSALSGLWLAIGGLVLRVRVGVLGIHEGAAGGMIVGCLVEGGGV